METIEYDIRGQICPSSLLTAKSDRSHVVL